LPVEPDSEALGMFRLVLAQGRDLIRQRNLIEAHAIELLAHRSDYQLLTSIPGIGPINALTILAEAGNIQRFVHHRQFLNFAVWTWPPSSRALSKAKAKSQNTEMLACDEPYGWLVKRPFCNAPIASATNSNAIFLKTDTIRICVVRPTQPWQQKWRGPYTP